MEQIQTNRMRLRRLRASDLESLHTLHNDADVMRWINGGDVTPLSVTRNRTLPAFMRQPADAPWSGYWAADMSGHGFAGWFSLRPESNGASIGYRLTRTSWGQGLATEGARALLAGAFGEAGLDTVTTSTYEENTGSRRVLEKLGFTLTRRFRLAPEDLQASETAHITTPDVWDGDELEYTLLKCKWTGTVAKANPPAPRPSR